MKQLATLLFAVGVLFGFDYHLKPTQVTEGVYCFFGATEEPNEANGGNMVNSCFMDVGTGWLVIDSGPTFQYAKQAFTAMQGIKNLPVTHVINTHPHDDHWLGNGYYKAQGATIIGPKSMLSVIDPAAPTRMGISISKEAYSGTTVVLPDTAIGTEYEMTIGNQKAIFRQPVDVAHSVSDLVVLFPQKEIIFVGDLSFSDSIPSATSGNARKWLQAIEAYEAMPWKLMVGGHGKKTDRKAPLLTKNYLTAVLEAVQKAMDDGVELDGIVEAVPLPEFKNYPLYEPLHGKNLYRAYQLLEWEE